MEYFMPGVEGRVALVTGAGRGIGKVAEVIVFLASEEASGVNGEAITVALGGLT
jgi:NAD(P)-dependent dehydrogenase (short-subunit alcohol dehydrogenase family)